MEYKVIIDSFEGPLDLLLHLVKKSNIDICDINFIFNGIEVAEFLDETVAINFWGWFLFWLLVPTSSTIVERSK